MERVTHHRERFSQTSAPAPPHGSDQSHTSTSHAIAHAPPTGTAPAAVTLPSCAHWSAARLLEDQLDQDIADLNAIVIRALGQRRTAAARLVQDAIALLIDSRTDEHIDRIERARGLR